MRIKDIASENRPRERLKQNGVESLSNTELLAVILQKGTASENVIDMSNRLLSKYSIDKLSECSLTELKSIPGIGDAKAMQIIALFELSKRVNQSKNLKKIIRIESAQDVFNYFVDELKDKKKEHFYVLSLDSKNQIITHSLISIGSLDASLIHPREIFKEAIKNSAASIVLVHNHPSGDPTPSEQDNEVTQLLINSGDMLDIKVIDHIIIGKNKFYSFKEKSELIL
jgi:DNA repair protein RadC